MKVDWEKCLEKCLEKYWEDLIDCELCGNEAETHDLNIDMDLCLDCQGKYLNAKKEDVKRIARERANRTKEDSNASMSNL